MRIGRLVLALLFAAAALVTALSSRTTPAGAANVERQAWTRTGMVPSFLPAENRIYVALTAGSEEARAFVHLDVADLDTESLAQSVLVLEEADDALLPDTALLTGCLLTSGFSGIGELAADDAPTVDCSVRAEAARDAEGRWRLALAVFAEPWSDGIAYGLALLPDTTTPASTFRLAFDTSRTLLGHPTGSSSTTSTTAATTDATTTSTVDDSATDVFPEEVLEPSFVFEPPSAGGTILPSSSSSTTVTVASLGPEEVAAPRPVARSSTPPALPVLLGVVALAIGVTALPRHRRRLVVPPRAQRVGGMRTAAAAVVAAAVLLPMTATEVTVYRAGLVLVFLVGAIGLHILVNWAGELSLAHAGMVGLPAFVVIAVSEVHGVSPVYLLPVGCIVGAAVGSVVALPVLRAKGIQVALVTLAAAIAIDRFFLAQPWLVGEVRRRAASSPRLGPIELTTSRSLYPLLVVVVAGAVAVAWALLHSKVGRAWFWVRAHPDAAAAFGIPVVRYRILAYAAAGAFAGLSGALSVLWIQRLTPDAFPTTQSFVYLVVAVLSGPGFVGGLAVAAAVLEGSRHFSSGAGTLVDYVGPLALIVTITRYRGGLNGIGRNIMLRTHRPLARDDQGGDPISLAFVLGCTITVLGFVGIALAWYHAGNTASSFVQLQELISGGLGGLAAVVLGTGLLVRDRLGSRASVRPGPSEDADRAPAEMPLRLAPSNRDRRGRRPSPAVVE